MIGRIYPPLWSVLKDQRLNFSFSPWREREIRFFLRPRSPSQARSSPVRTWMGDRVERPEKSTVFEVRESLFSIRFIDSPEYLEKNGVSFTFLREACDF